MTPAADVLRFWAPGGWKVDCLVSFDGIIQDQISGLALFPEGFTVINGAGRQKTIALLDLLNRLKGKIEVLQL